MHICQWTRPLLVQVMAWYLKGDKPLPEPVMTNHQLCSSEQTLVKYQSKYKHFHSQKCAWKCCLQNGVHFVQASCCQSLLWIFQWPIWCLFNWLCWPATKKSSQLNSLAPGKFEWNFRYLILQIITVIYGWGISCEFTLRWMSLDLTDDKSTLVQVMAWCRQATSHYLIQGWPRSLSPCGVARPQWVNWIIMGYWPSLLACWLLI